MIIKFWTLVQNFILPSNVPYPWLQGKEHTYLMIEDAVLPNKMLDIKKDAYMQFYGYDEGNVNLRKHMRKLKRKTVHKRIL